MTGRGRRACAAPARIPGEVMPAQQAAKKSATGAGWLATLPAGKRQTAEAVIALVRKHVPKGCVEAFG